MDEVRRLGPYFHKKQGYNYFVYICPDGKRKTVYEHREVIEKKNGIKLDTKQHVHHKNERKTDNTDLNLEVLSASEHAKKHAVPPKTETLICTFCGNKFTRRARKINRSSQPYCSRHCVGLANAQRSGFKETPIRHGILSSYSYRGCRCELCRKAQADAHRNYYRKKKSLRV